ncbi:hypothetical protein BDR07DRAFT_1402324 [Suillus spraguei]|nr:hypothetical protein BDR07DRAFT_1402324 [Suillus spraguei]
MISSFLCLFLPAHGQQCVTATGTASVGRWWLHAERAARLGGRQRYDVCADFHPDRPFQTRPPPPTTQASVEDIVQSKILWKILCTIRLYGVVVVSRKKKCYINGIQSRNKEKIQ